MKSWQDFDYVLLVSVPLFLFSGTFYPLSRLPAGRSPTSWQWTPLYQGVVMLRDLVLGVPSPELLWRAGYLAALGAARADGGGPPDRANCCWSEPADNGISPGTPRALTG